MVRATNARDEVETTGFRPDRASTAGRYRRAGSPSQHRVSAMATDSPDLGVDQAGLFLWLSKRSNVGGVFGGWSAVSVVDAEAWRETLDQFLVRLTDEQYRSSAPLRRADEAPAVAVVGYLAAMLISPNNHALDGEPSAAAMEKECVERLAAMFGMDQHLGHLTSSGTIAITTFG